jgi:hypothetical protein
MKFLRYIFLILGCLVWIVGLSPSLVSEAMKRGWIEDGYQYGDLYRLSNLSDFRDPRKGCPDYTPPAHAPTGKKIHLYIIGDSFTETQRVGKKDFPVDNYTYVHWSDFLHIKIDTSEINILLIESVERHFRQKMVSQINVLVPDTATFVAKFASTKFMHQLDDVFKSGFTEDRLDATLFQNDLMLRVKEWKSDFNHTFFGRNNSGVTLVKDDQDMVYYMDTDTTITSSFYKLKDTEVDTIVMNLNKSTEFADSLGFEHVILSVIPNKISIVNPDFGNYNRLIERVYAHPKLSVPYIDVLSDFRKMGKTSYQNGDSHWTCEGQYLWLNKVNTLINKLVEQPSI